MVACRLTTLLVLINIRSGVRSLNRRSLETLADLTSSRTVRHARMLAHAQGARARGRPKIEHCSGSGDGNSNRATSAKNPQLAGETEPVQAAFVIDAVGWSGTQITANIVSPLDYYGSHVPALPCPGAPSTSTNSPPPPVDDWSLNCSHLPATVPAVHDALDFWCSYGSHLPVTLATVDTGQLCAVCGCPTKQFCLACQISLCSNQRKHKLTLYIRGQPNTVYISCSQWYHRFTLLPAIEHAGQQRMIASLRYELTHYPQSIKVDDDQ